MVEIKDFRKFMEKEFPNMPKSQVKSVCDGSQETIDASSSNKAALINVAERYGYEGSGARNNTNFNNAREFLDQKLAEARLGARGVEKVVRAEVPVGGGRPKTVSAPIAGDLSMLDNPAAVSGAWIDRMARELPEGYAVVVPPQTVYLELPHGKRDISTPIYELEKRDYSHLSPAEQRARDTPLKMMVVKSPDGSRLQIMNTPNGQLTVTPLSGQQVNSMPNVYNPVPPGATVCTNFDSAMGALLNPQKKASEYAQR